MFRDDFEFHDGAAPSHLGAMRRARAGAGSRSRPAPAVVWAPEAEQELGKIPFFVRGKARRNTERFAARTRPRRPSPWRRCTMPKRISAADATPIRVVIVTMDSHLSGAAARAEADAARGAAGPRSGRARGRRVGHRRRGARRLPRRHRARRHRGRDHAVPGGPHPRRAAGAGGPARRLRRHAVLHVGRRDHAADPARPVQHGAARRPARMAHAEEAARRQARRRRQRRGSTARRR